MSGQGGMGVGAGVCDSCPKWGFVTLRVLSRLETKYTRTNADVRYDEVTSEEHPAGMSSGVETAKVERLSV